MRAMEEAVASIMSPFNAPGIGFAGQDTSCRLPSLGSDTTAISPSWGWYPGALNIAGQAGEGIALGQTAGFVFRDPVRNSVIQQIVSAPQTYTAWFCRTDAPPAPGVARFETMGADTIDFNIAYWQAQSVGSIHGPRLYPGSSQFKDETSYVFMNAGDGVTVTSANATGTAPDGTAYAVGETCLVGISQYQGTSSETTLRYVASAATFVAPQTGYYSIRGYVQYAGGTPTNGKFGMDVTLTLTVGTNATQSNPLALWAHRALPQFESLVLSADDFRMTGVGLLYQNNTPVQYLAGTITAANVSRNRMWQEILGNFTQLRSFKRSSVMPQNNTTEGLGAKVVIKPDGFDALDFKVCTSVKDSVLHKAWFVIENSDDFACIFVDAAASNGNVPGNGSAIGQFQVANNIEYHTSDITRQCSYSSMRSASMDDLFDLLKGVPSIGSNDFHWKDVIDGINDTLGGIATGVGHVANIGKNLIPFASLFF